MSNADALGRLVKCPLYHSTDGQTTISCEGPDDLCRCGLAFLSRAAYARWRRSKCNSAYRYCPIYSAIIKLKFPTI